jgi:TPR repeat protein
MYALGQGVTKNVQESNKWYLLAAKQENTKAKTNLGLSYFLGIVVP